MAEAKQQQQCCFLRQTDVVPEEADDLHLHHRGPTLISMHAFTGWPAAAVNALHFIYQ